MKRVTASSIDEYIAAFPAEVQRILQRIRTVIRKAAPDAVEAIKYQIPTFVLQENLVHFAAFERHVGFYPTPSAIEAFSGELAECKSAQGSVQFPLDRPMPLDLIRRMVEFRVEEVQKKLAAPRRKKK